mmetsp:Transcript_6257/g.18891  ORF Transcript_6257/g.18891 Transcript_6257/m.18891 type:complete len:124 (-) Transcript_6257:161-532(-)
MAAQRVASDGLHRLILPVRRRRCFDTGQLTRFSPVFSTSVRKVRQDSPLRMEQGQQQQVCRATMQGAVEASTASPTPVELLNWTTSLYGWGARIEQTAVCKRQDWPELRSSDPFLFRLKLLVR